VALVPKFQAMLSAPGAMNAPAAGASDSTWAKVNKAMKTFLTKVAPQLNDGVSSKSKVVSLIDTNPSLSVWTQMALTADDNLIVPVNADNFSTAAINNMFFSVYMYGLYGYGGTMAQYEETMFTAVAKKQGLTMPKIQQAIIHNRSTIHANEPRGAFAAMSADQAQALWNAFTEAKKQGMASSVFCLPGGKEPTSVVEFSGMFTGVMRDMQGSGVATTHSGIPMWMVVCHKNNIKQSLAAKIQSIKTSAQSSMADFIGTVGRERARKGGLLGLITGKQLDQDATAKMWSKEYGFYLTETKAYGCADRRGTLYPHTMMAMHPSRRSRTAMLSRRDRRRAVRTSGTSDSANSRKRKEPTPTSAK
jgi:hypothetical protein